MARQLLKLAITLVCTASIGTVAAEKSMKAPAGFTKIPAADEVFINDPGREGRSSLLVFSKISENLPAAFASDAKIQALYQDGIRQILENKGIRNVSFLTTKKVSLKKRSGLLFDLNFIEGGQVSHKISNRILILSDSQQTLQLDFQAPQARMEKEWRDVLRSFEESLL